MSKTYNQVPDDNVVTLGIERFMIGAYGATVSTGRIDISSPWAGFYDLGVVVEDSPTVRIRRNTFSLELGLPRTLQYEVVLSVGAEVEFSVYGASPFQAQFMLANTEMTTVTTITTATSAAQYYGKSSIIYYTLIGVSDFLNGSQVQHVFNKVTASGDWEEQFRPETPGQVKYTFKAMGYEITDSNTCTHLVVGERRYYGPGGVCVI